MRIALGQMNVKVGKLQENITQMLDMIERAKKEKADLIIFPEMAVSGYVLCDKWLDESFCDSIIQMNHVLKQASDNIGIIWGSLGRFDHIKGRDGRKARCNCAYFAYNQEWVQKENQLFDGMYVKYLNPDYRVFDDSRYFYSALELAHHLKQDKSFMTSPFLFKRNGKTYRIGIEICEDLWSGDYNFDPTSYYLQDECDCIVNISSSPWTKNKEIGRHKQIKRHVEKNQKFVDFIYVNAVGMQNQSKTVCVFDGDSTVYDCKGNRKISCNDSFEAELKVANLNETSLSQVCDNKLLKALVCAIREFDDQVFNKRFKWLIGLSGGLDSSVNAALLTLAVGKDRVIGLNMATKYNSSTTIDNAHVEAKALGIECRDGIIQSLVEEQINCLKQYTEIPISEFAIENIQARIRGNILGGISQIENAVIINNGNKIESAFGYATLYGDTIGCLAPLQDCTKVELFEIAHSINELLGKEVVPYNLLPVIEDDEIKWEMPPSAELKNNQKDPMKWFYHDELVQIYTEYPGFGFERFMQKYLDGSLKQESIWKWIMYYGLDDPKAFIDDLEWVISKIELGVFKRLQTPPIVMISRGSFGSDFRENQSKYEKSQLYLALKEAILNENQ